MKKITLILAILLFSGVSFAFSGGSLGRVSKQYRTKTGVDAIGVRMGGSSVVNVTFVECDRDENAEYRSAGVCGCKKGYERVGNEMRCQPTQCDAGHLNLCETKEACQDIGAFWCQTTKKCMLTANQCCSEKHLSVCQTWDLCIAAGGSWIRESCREAVCDMDHLELCSNEFSCVHAFGVWCNRLDKCVALKDECICPAGSYLAYTTRRCTKCGERAVRSTITPSTDTVSLCDELCDIGEKANADRTKCIPCADDELCGCPHARKGHTCIELE